KQRQRVKYGSPHLDGTVCIFGWQLFLLPLWDLDMRTLPSLQTPGSYNYYLAEHDTQFLSGNTAPDHVLFGVSLSTAASRRLRTVSHGSHFWPITNPPAMSTSIWIYAIRAIPARSRRTRSSKK